jgi:hypothetical protein
MLIWVQAYVTQFRDPSGIVRDEMSTSPLMFFQIGLITVSAITEAVEGEIQISSHDETHRLGFK